MFVIIIFIFHFFFGWKPNIQFRLSSRKMCVPSKPKRTKQICVWVMFFFLFSIWNITRLLLVLFAVACCCCLLLLLNAVEAICFRLGFNYFETKMHMGNDTFTNHLNCLYSTAMGRIIFSFGTGVLSNIWFNSAVHAHPNDGAVERDHGRDGRDNWDCTDHCLCWCVAKVDFTVYQLESNCGTFQRFHGLEFVWKRLYSCSSCVFYVLFLLQFIFENWIK